MPDRPPSGANEEGARRRKPGFSSRLEAFERFSTRAPFSGFDEAALTGYLEEGLVDGDKGTVLLACRPETEAAIYATAAAFDLLGVLDRVTCPVTVAFGGSSDVMSGTGAEVVASRLVRGQTVSIPGLDHFGPFKAPHIVANEVLRALRTPGA
jgi:pimeloyl-ACP methyl ester carboxylesterase